MGELQSYFQSPLKLLKYIPPTYKSIESIELILWSRIYRGYMLDIILLLEQLPLFAYFYIALEDIRVIDLG